MSLDLDTATLTDAVAAIVAGEVGSEELLNAQLDRVDIFNPSVNAVVAFDIERATAEARAADEARVAGRVLGPLGGIPLTVKDTFETAGCVTTAGAPALADHVPEFDADVVAGLRDAGAVIFGKTNVPLMPVIIRHTTTCTASPGIRRIPNAPRAVPPVVSAVSVACGFSLGEYESDIGSSIRLPPTSTGCSG